jgi:formate dehydrogenase subunit gamma
VLLATGLCLYLPALAEAVGRRELFKAIHFYTAVGWLAALLVLAVVGNGQALLATAREIDRFDADDLAWLRDRSRPSGRLNAGQKLNSVASAAFALLFTVTGFLLWYGERDTRFRFANTILIHDWLMYVSVVLVAGHLYLALFNRSTRHSLSGMTRGWVRADWAREHHAKWVGPAEPDGGAQPSTLGARATE